jgi:anthranilate synthase component 2
MKKLVLIDNYDSFTYTIKNYFESLGISTVVIRNDDLCLRDLESLNPSHLLLSPGPGNPDDSGFTLEIIKNHYKHYPILGICLGHQCIMQAFGGNIIHAPEVMHGKLSKLTHTGDGLFTNLPNDFNVMRYHSLIVDWEKVPPEFKISGWTLDSLGRKIVMAFHHKTYPLFGIQYHPEAILTEHGLEIVRNFLKT